MYSEGLGQTVNTMFDESCERWGSRIALVEGDTRLTFLQLRRRAAGVATGLRRAGVQPGDRVAVLVGVGTEWTLTFYALMRIGAIAIPLNLTWTGREIEGGLTLTEATVLVGHGLVPRRRLPPAGPGSVWPGSRRAAR
jgi:acyl-CoA synthetase (AMP-forming)/AMP-acid ligase II